MPLVCDKFIVIIMNYAPIAPCHAASRHADRHARCAALRIVCIGYRNALLLLLTAKARTLCVYVNAFVLALVNSVVYLICIVVTILYVLPCLIKGLVVL